MPVGRKETWISQSDAAEIIGVSRSTVMTLAGVSIRRKVIAGRPVLHRADVEAEARRRRAADARGSAAAIGA